MGRDITTQMKKKRELPSAFYGLMLAAVCAVWGLSNAVSKLGFEVITPLWALAVRYFAAFWLFLIFFGKRIRTRIKKSDIRPCVLVSVLTAIAFVLGFIALDNTSATNCGFLMSLAVVFVPILSVFLLKSKFEAKFLIPVAIAAAGLFFICGGKLDALCSGDIVAILCSCASALMVIFSVKYLGSADIDPMVLCITQCAVCFIFSLPLAIIFEQPPDLIHMPAIGWYTIALVTVGGTFMAYTFQNIAFSRVSPTFGALVYCTEPIFTSVSAYFILGERMTPITALGAVLITASIVLASIFDAKRGQATN